MGKAASESIDGNPKWRLIRQDDAEAGKATFPELFFDLVFVFALIQLSHTLAKNFGATALVEAGIIILALWWLWIHTTWLTNLLNTETGPVRLFLFLMMFAGVLLAITLPEAFDDQGLVFATIYISMQLGRSLFALYVFKGLDHENSRTFGRISIWLAFASLFWLAGAMSPDTGWHVAFWAVAIGIEYLGPLTKYRIPGHQIAEDESLHLSGEHLAERCALFVIICLGETILSTGRTATDYMNSPLVFLVFCAAFSSTVVMWWIYFHHGQQKVSEKVEDVSEPEEIAQNLFNYGHLPIVAGIILTAVGEEFSLSHSHDYAEWREGIAIIGGPILFLAGNIGVKVAASYVRPLSHFAGIAVLTILLFLPAMPLYVLQISSASVLFMVAVWEYVALRKQKNAVA